MGSKRDALVEVMETAIRLDLEQRERVADGLPEVSAQFWRAHPIDIAHLALSAALTATEDEECGECGGAGKVGRQYRFAPNPPGYQFDDCAACDGSGSIPGKPLIIGAAVEAGIDVVDALVKLGVLPASRATAARHALAHYDQMRGEEA